MPPASPAPVNPFFTPEDLAALNSFNTEYATNLANINFDLSNLQTDTTFQKAGVEKSAKAGTAATQDDAASRGIFQSSIKDAAIYDIEAQRALQSKFLDDKLTTARLDAGTRKGILATSKENFDKAMAARQVENARAVNDASAASWADAMAAFQASQSAAGPPAKGVDRSGPPAKGAKRSSTGSSNASAYAAAAQAYARSRGRR